MNFHLSPLRRVPVSRVEHRDVTFVSRDGHQHALSRPSSPSAGVSLQTNAARRSRNRYSTDIVMQLLLLRPTKCTHFSVTIIHFIKLHDSYLTGPSPGGVIVQTIAKACYHLQYTALWWQHHRMIQRNAYVHSHWSSLCVRTVIGAAFVCAQ